MIFGKRDGWKKVDVADATAHGDITIGRRRFKRSSGMDILMK